jgi:hypothetical protein
MRKSSMVDRKELEPIYNMPSKKGNTIFLQTY